jgi:acyl-CoA thioesterase FadM
MNLWFRLLVYALLARFRPAILPPFGVSRLMFRVWPTDLDTSLHMNNGRYLTLMDLGRVDLLVGMGLAGEVIRRGWTPILSAAKIRYRRELKTWRRFALESRIVWWSDTLVVMEQRFVSVGKENREVVNASALVLAGIYDRKVKAFVPIADLIKLSGHEVGPAPEPSPEVEAFLAANDALKRAVAA